MKQFSIENHDFSPALSHAWNSTIYFSLLGIVFPRQSLLNWLRNLQNLNWEHYEEFLKFYDEGT